MLAPSRDPSQRRAFDPPSSFVGRTEELAALAALVQGGARLVSLVGPGGVGKTRLATRFADSARLEPWFCQLADCRALGDVVARVGAAIDVPLTSGSDLDDAIEQIGYALDRRGPVLLVLDNVEQVREVVTGVVATWARMAPHAALLVTSRQPLHIDGEQRLLVEPLPPEDAQRLFVERARSVRSGLTDDDRADVAELVERLDRLPLAIELAAARYGVMTPAELITRLGLRVLSSRRRDVDERHATLYAAIDWSWAELTGAERVALAQCAVFRGGFSLPAAEAVIDAGPGAPAAVDLLESLRDQSLLRSYDTPGLTGATRFALYASVRAFAAEKLAELDPGGATAARHGRTFLEAGEGWAAEVHGPESERALQQLRLERDNLMAARDAAPPDQALRGLLAVATEMSRSGPIAPLRELLDAAAASGEPLGEALASRLAAVRGEVAFLAGDLDGAAATLEDARSRARGSGLADVEAEVLIRLGAISSVRLRQDLARRQLARAVELGRTAGAAHLEGLALVRLGGVSLEQGRASEAVELYEQALAVLRRAGDRPAEALALMNLGIVHRDHGRPDEARRCLEDALDAHGDTRDQRFLAACLTNLGNLEGDAGRIEAGCAYHRRAVDVDRHHGCRLPEGLHLYNVATFEHAAGRLDEAHEALEGAVEAVTETGNVRVRGALLVERARLDHEAGDLDAARTAIAEALELFGDGYKPGKVLALAHRAALVAEAGHVLDARADLREARQTAEAATLPRMLPLVDLLEAGVDLIESEQLHLGGASDDEVQSGRDRATLRAAAALAAPAGRSPNSLIAERIFRRVEARSKAAAEDAGRDGGAELLVGPSGSWFKVGDAPRVDLSRRRTLNRVLQVLVDHRLSQPGAELASGVLYARAWQGETASSSAQRTRLRVAIATLRKLGLRDVLLHREGGYLLDPEISTHRFGGEPKR